MSNLGTGRERPAVPVIPVNDCDISSYCELHLDTMRSSPDHDAAWHAAELVGVNSSASVAADRRIEIRRPINIGFHIVPLDRRGNPINSASFTARGKNISASGLAVSHMVAMEYPRALVTSMGSSADRIQVEAEVAWTGPAGNGVFETGFKIMRRIG
jgi:hypothetical protein